MEEEPEPILGGGGERQPVPSQGQNQDSDDWMLEASKSDQQAVLSSAGADHIYGSSARSPLLSALLGHNFSFIAIRFHDAYKCTAV